MSCAQVLAADHPIPGDVPRDVQHIHLSPTATAPREARQFVRAAASVIDDDRLQDLMVLTSELVTNAVIHARTSVEVGVTVTDLVVLVCVGDGVESHPEARPPSDGREDGRGIMLVRSLADDWGVTAEVSRPGKAVWFLLRRDQEHGDGCRVT